MNYNSFFDLESANCENTKMAENIKMAAKTSPIHSAPLAATPILEFERSKDVSQLSNDSCFKVPKSIVKA
jgi:hypothetical protein